MAYSNHKNAFKQLRAKPVKLKKFLKHNVPKKRSCGLSLKRCSRCGRIRSGISMYGLRICRQCFRETAKDIGFKKYS